MPTILPDQTKPLDLVGLEERVLNGYHEAVCPGCGSSVRLGHYYKADRVVIRSVPHKYPCEHYETLLKTGRLLHDG